MSRGGQGVGSNPIRLPIGLKIFFRKKPEGGFGKKTLELLEREIVL